MDVLTKLNYKKCPTVVGCYPDTVFQLSLLNRDADDAESASGLGHIPTFSGLGFLCVPQIGTYGDDYWPTIPLVVLELPTKDWATLKQQLPTNLFATLEEYCQDKECCALEFYMMVHTPPPPSPCQKFICDNMNEANLMYHPWTLPDAQFDDSFVANTTIMTGLYSPHGVEEVHQDLQDGGIAFEKVKEMKVIIHNCAFSPENCSFSMRYDVSHCSFFSLAIHGFRRVVTFHSFPRQLEDEDTWRESIGSSSNVGELLQNIQILEPDLAKKMENILIPLCNSLPSVHSHLPLPLCNFLPTNESQPPIDSQPPIESQPPIDSQPLLNPLPILDSLPDQTKDLSPSNE